MDDLVSDLDQRANQGLGQLNPRQFSVHNESDVRKFQNVGLLVKSLSEITKIPILDEAGKLTAASQGIKAKYQNLELEPTAVPAAKPVSPKLAGVSADVQAQLVQLIRMKTPLPAVQRSAQLLGFSGDITSLYRAYS